MDTKTRGQTVEVWLTRDDNEMTFSCWAVGEDEKEHAFPAKHGPNWRITSRSMRGAQREVTADLINNGYSPIGRWQTEAKDSDGEATETVRQFRLPAD